MLEAEALDKEVASFADWAETARTNGVPVEEIAARWTAWERLSRQREQVRDAWCELVDGLLDVLWGYPHNLERREELLGAAEAEARDAIEEAKALIAEGAYVPSEEAITPFAESLRYMEKAQRADEIDGMDEAFLLRVRAYVGRIADEERGED